MGDARQHIHTNIFNHNLTFHGRHCWAIKRHTEWENLNNMIIKDDSDSQESHFLSKWVDKITTQQFILYFIAIEVYQGL